MSNLLLILIILGIGLLLGAGFLIYYFVFVEEEDEEEEKQEFDGAVTAADGLGATLADTLAATSEEARGARKSRMLALKDSLERSLEGREGEGAESKNRMSMPWFLLVGGPGSGKTTMLANTGLPLPYGPAFEVDSRRRDAGRWWLFEEAVVLEAPAASAAAAASDSTLPPGQTLVADTSEGWNTLLHMLRRERPDAPLNGIIVTVSCNDLVAGGRDSERLAEVADRIRLFLDKTREVLEVRLPIHVLVTKCDVLPGFRSFADNLPEGRRNDIFGWANPNKLESTFNPSWVDVGMDALKRELEDLRDEVLAAPDEITDADGLFVFVNEFGNLQEPLRDFVSRLYGENERRPPLFFRGIYFCGDAIDPDLAKDAEATLTAAGKTRATMQLSAEVALSGTTATHNLVFLRTLFTDKIFREAGLARPVARFRLSRDRRVVIAQMAAAVIAVVGSWGLWTAVNGGGIAPGDSVAQRGLRAEAEALSHALAGMAIDLDEMKRGSVEPVTDSFMERRMREAAVLDLVEEMRALNTLKRSPFIPASWFSPLPNDVTNSIQAGIQEIVLPVIRQRLEERVNALLDSAQMDEGAPEGGTSMVMSNPRVLAEYLQQVAAVSRRVNQFNRLALPDSGSIEDLASLVDYLFGVQMETGPTTLSPDFQAALVTAAAPAIAMPARVGESVVARAMSMVSSLGVQAGTQLARRSSAAQERAVVPQDDLRALQQLGTLSELSDSSRGILRSLTDTLILGSNPARLVHDSIVAQLRGAAIMMSGDSAAADLQLVRLRRVLDTLFSLRLMDPIDEGEIVADFGPHERLRWDVGRLELALSMRQEYDRAVATVIEAMSPGQSPDRLRRAFDGQLRGRVLTAASAAQRLTPIEAGSPLSEEVRQGSANLDAAATRLFRLERLMDTLRVGDAGRRLVSSATRQAEQVLGMAQQLLETETAMMPLHERIAAWQGVIPIGWPAVGASDSLGFETARLPLENGVRALTQGAAPVLQFLTRVPATEVRVPRLVTEWTALVATMQRYERGDATTSVTALRRYLFAMFLAKDLGTCTANAALPDTGRPSPDIFVKRRLMFRAALVGRCGNGGPEAVTAYERLRTQFNTRLAGRYPFVDSTQVDAADVDPALVRDFLTQYDTFMASSAVALRSSPTLVSASAAAVAFLEAFRPVRTFFGPLLDLPDRQPLQLSIVMMPPDSATDRELTVGARTIVVDDQPHVLRWRFGDTVRVIERDSAGAAQLILGSRSAWSILPLSQDPRVRVFHANARVELPTPPAFPASAPGLVEPPRPSGR